MPRRDRSELLQDLPRLRRNFEASRQLAAEAVERARRLAQETDARKRLLETAATESKTRGGTRDTYIWEAAARELLRAARERDRELGVVADPSAERVVVAGDQARLRQALINLLHNAVR